jgi:hypothetical protein
MSVRLTSKPQPSSHFGHRGWYWLDPAVALVIAAVIGYRALTLIRPVLVAIKTHAAQGLLFRRQLQQHLCNSFGS